MGFGVVFVRVYAGGDYYAVPGDSAGLVIDFLSVLGI
jgi:hypothetical protein